MEELLRTQKSTAHNRVEHALTLNPVVPQGCSTNISVDRGEFERKRIQMMIRAKYWSLMVDVMATSFRQ